MRILNEEAARARMKEVTEKSRRLMAEMIDIEKNLTELERFFRREADEQHSYANNYSLKIAGNDMARIGRQVPIAMNLLKHLSNLAYPLVFEEQKPKTDTQQSSNKINKNVSAPRIAESKPVEPKEE